MSTPPLQRASCTNKVRHKSLNAAWASIRLMEKQEIDVKGIRPYRCRYCGGYHTGHHGPGGYRR